MKKGNKEPNPTVQISVQDTKKDSKVNVVNVIKRSIILHANVDAVFPCFFQTCYTTVDPEWEEAFTFFIQDPHKQDIDFQVSSITA